MSFLRLFLDAAAWRPGGETVRPARGLALLPLQAGGCDGCAAEIDALRAGAYDLERSNIRFVDAPREAELLLVTGAATRAMVPWIQGIWQQMAAPKGIALVGDCALGLGPFAPGYALAGGIAEAAFAGLQRCDLALGGCPPAPADILHALRRLAAGEIVLSRSAAGA